MLVQAAWPQAPRTDVARAVNAALACLGQGAHCATPDEYEVLQRAYLRGAMSSGATPSASSLDRTSPPPPPA